MDRRAILKYTAYVTGYALTAPLTSAFLSGCKAEPAALDFQPAFFKEDAFRNIRAMVDTMLPKTTTPGAVEMGVPEFIDLVLKTYTAEDVQERIQEGLNDWLSITQKSLGKSYYELEAKEQLRLLNELDAGAKVKSKAIEETERIKGWQNDASDEEEDEPQPWWIELKGLAINGFFASEHIGTEVLAYDPVPGVYDGNYPLSEVGRAWSL